MTQAELLAHIREFVRTRTSEAGFHTAIIDLHECVTQVRMFGARDDITRVDPNDRGPHGGTDPKWVENPHPALLRPYLTR